MTDPAASAEPAPAPAAAAADPTAIIRSRSYVALLLVGAVIGVPVAAVAYFWKRVPETEGLTLGEIEREMGELTA